MGTGQYSNCFHTEIYSSTVCECGGSWIELFIDRWMDQEYRYYGPITRENMYRLAPGIFQVHYDPLISYLSLLPVKLRYSVTTPAFYPVDHRIIFNRLWSDVYIVYTYRDYRQSTRTPYARQWAWLGRGIFCNRARIRVFLLSLPPTVLS